MRFLQDRMGSGLLLCTVLFSGCGPAADRSAQDAAQEDRPSGQSVDLVLHNGNILALDEANTQGSVLVVDRGRVLAVGDAALLQAYQAAERIDLQGRTVMPGFNDTHVHINGRPTHYIDLTQVTSIAAMQARVAAKAAEVGVGNWVTGYGWSEDQLAEARKPTLADLDAAAPNNPVMLTRAGAHSAVFSSAAFALAGIDAQTPDPEGGAIERHADGTLNGIIRERHNELVGKLIPPAAPESLRPSLVRELQKLFALGITSITQAMNPLDYYAEWQAAYAQYPGQLPRASVQHYYAGHERMQAFRAAAGEGDDFLKVGPIKLLADGGFTGPAAYTKQPYQGEDTYRGALNLPVAEIESIITQAHNDGWQLGVHAIGDAAIELVVDILVKALAANPRADHRHYLNHFTVMPSLATMDLMAQHGIAITQQPNFLYTLEGRYVEYLGGERLQNNNPMATPMSRGIHVAMSSDILPLGPWVGIYAATTRKGQSGTIYGASEKISRLAALRAYTLGGAFLNREEDRKGTLSPGKWADFIVLDENPLTVADESLLQMSTRATYLAGRQVYARES